MLDRSREMTLRTTGVAKRDGETPVLVIVVDPEQRITARLEQRAVLWIIDLEIRDAPGISRCEFLHYLAPLCRILHDIRERNRMRALCNGADESRNYKHAALSPADD